MAQTGTTQANTQKKPTGVEISKLASRGLRGGVADELASTETRGGVSEDSFNLLKFHGTYEQFDRDTATPRKQAGLDKEWQFMVRVRAPAGLLTAEQYLALDALADRLRAFADRFGVQVYLEPGEAAITKSTTLEVTVLDTLHNGKNLAIVDSSIEAHMLDLLIYRLNAKMAPNDGEHSYMVCGKSCLAGDIFGEYQFDRPLAIGDRLSFIDAAGYTMVKKNWFNGLKMPSIVVKQLDGSVEVVREFDFNDYLSSLS